MKKLKLLGLFAMMLVVATVLASCGNVSNLNKIFNKDYDANGKLYTAATKLDVADGYEEAEFNDEFVLFENDEENKIKVFSFRAGAFVGNVLTSDEDNTYDVSFVDGAPLYVVTKTTSTEDDEDKVMKYYHDATGAEIVSVEAKFEIGSAKVVTDDLVIINSVMYTIDQENGSAKKKADVPAYVSYDEFVINTDKNFYAYDGTTLVIYDLDFAPVATYTVPSYAEELDGAAPVCLLNGGNILLQYVVELDEDAKKFDISENGAKLDLISVLVTPNGKVKNLNLDYAVVMAVPNFMVYDDTKAAEDNEVTDKWDNIASIAKIENKKIDFTEANLDFVLMNNSAKVQNSLKFVDGQTDMPEKVAKDLFAVETVYGTALINEKGKLQFAVTEMYQEIVGDYIITDRAIYNLSFELVYNLIAEEATVEDTVGRTVFVKDGEEDKYDIIAFCDGEKKTVYSYDVEKETNDDFEMTEFGYVIIGDETYTYYTANGTELLKTEKAIEGVPTNNYNKALYKVATEDGYDYYVFTK